MSTDNVTIKTLMAAGVHFGHHTRKLNSHMSPFISGTHSGIHIINLDKTLPMLRQACLAIKDIASKGARIVFIGTRPIAQRLTYECAMACEQFYVNLRWLGGTITNREHVLGKVDLVPDLLVILDYPNNRAAIREAVHANIPTIAICDTDCDPSVITYPIPGNDDGLASVELIGRTLAQAAFDGKTATKPLPNATIVASATAFVSRHNPGQNPSYSQPQLGDEQKQ